MVFPEETRTQEQIEQDRYNRFEWELSLADQFLGFIRPSFIPGVAKPRTIRAIKDTQAHMLIRLAQPIPGIWAELANRAALVKEPEYEYDFLQVVDSDIMHDALQDLLLILKIINTNAETFKMAIEHLNDPQRCEEKQCTQALAQLNRLLSVLDREAL